MKNVPTICFKKLQVQLLKTQIDPYAISKAISTAYSIQKQKKTLNRDTRLGVLGKNPVGVPFTWVINHVKTPFIQVCKIFTKTWKSVIL